MTWGITVFFFIGFINYLSGQSGTDVSESLAAKTNSKNYPESIATYKELNAQVGCGSKYSDDKKEDIFKANYKNHWMTWKGVVVLSEANNASLNIDRFGTQDLQIDFADPKAGYDLNKDTVIRVKFLMKQVGGCFLPFSGEHALIL